MSPSDAGRFRESFFGCKVGAIVDHRHTKSSVVAMPASACPTCPAPAITQHRWGTKIFDVFLLRAGKLVRKSKLEPREETSASRII